MSYDYKDLAAKMLPNYKFISTKEDIRYDEISYFECTDENIPKRRKNIFCKIIDSIPPQVTIINQLADKQLHLCHPHLLELIKYPDTFILNEDSNSVPEKAYSLCFETWDNDLRPIMNEHR